MRGACAILSLSCGLAPRAQAAVPNTLRDRLCQQRPGCKLEAPQDAGEDEAKRRLEVVLVDLKPENPDDCQGKPGEYWAVAWKGKTLDAVQHLVDVCPGSYGAAGGTDDITIGPNTFTDARWGGSTDRGAYTLTARLFPPKVLSEQIDAYRSGSPDAHSTQSWSYTDHTGTFSASMPWCDQDNSAVETPGVLVPATSLPASADWKSTALGDCAATVDSTAGPLVHGAAGSATDATLRVAQVGDSLWIEVVDDHVVASAPNPLYADHLELWLTDQGSQDCADKATVSVTQWLIGLDGTVSAGLHATGAPPTAQVLVADGKVRMRVVAPITSTYSVVWSDSDDGLSQKRLIGTSAVRFGDPRSLGLTWPVSCEVRDGKLMVVDAPPPQPDAVLLNL